MPTAHRPSRSGDPEDAARRNGTRPSRQPTSKAGPSGPSGPFDTPPPYEGPRPRANSESSVVDKSKQAEEDKKRRERRKEREARREKEGRSKDGKSRPSKRPQGLDVIDKLDVTGIYGQGREFAHPAAIVL